MASQDFHDDGKLEASETVSTDRDDNDVVKDAEEAGPPTDENEAPPATLVTPPPALQDGGTRAWLQVVGSFLVFTNLWGFTFAFGSFQDFYQLEYLSTQPPSSISWIGTVSTFLLIFVGIISGSLFDLGHFRSMLLIGACLETIGVFLLSLSTQYYQIMLTQGVLLGLGNGLLYLPGLALVGRSFKKHRSIAMAITTCGAPVGGIIYILMFESLISRLGFAWTIRSMGFFMLGSYCISFPLLLWRVTNLGNLASGTVRKLFDASALKDLLFWSYSMSNFCLFLGYMVPFIYFAAYGQTELGLNRSTALNMIVIAQAASVAGRLIVGWTAARIGVMVPWITCGLTSGLLCVAWIGVRDEKTFIAVAALYGCFSGALIPLPPSVFPVVCPDPRVLGARLGMAQAIGAFASLIGSPIAGSIAGSGAVQNYLGLQLFSGMVMVAGGIQLMFLWALLVRKREVKSTFI